MEIQGIKNISNADHVSDYTPLRLPKFLSNVFISILSLTLIACGGSSGNQSNAAPKIQSADTYVIPESNTSSLLRLEATDSDSDQLTYSIVGGADRDLFSINSTTGDLSSKGIFDYEAPLDSDGDNHYQVAVRVEDGRGGADSITINIEIEDLQEFSLSATFVKGMVNGASCELHAINNGGVRGSLLEQGVTINGAVDFGQSIFHSGSVLVSCIGGTYLDEATGLQLPAPLMRAIADLSEKSHVTVSPLTEISTSLAEISGNLNSALDRFNEEVSAAFGLNFDITEIIPADVRSEAVLNDDQGKYAALLALISQLDANSEGSLEAVIEHLSDSIDSGRLSVQAMEELKQAKADFINGGSDASINIGIIVLDSIISDTGIPRINISPRFDFDGPLIINIEENAEGYIQQLFAHDVDQDALAFSISGGLDMSAFSITPDTGQLSFLSSPNYEIPMDSNADNVYHLIVQVSDGNGGIDTEQLEVTVSNIDDEDFDGVPDVDDFYPNDAACSVETDGDGAQCYLSLLHQQGISHVDNGNGTIAYIALETKSKVLRFNSQTGHFLSPITIDNQKTLTSMAYSASHDRLYLGYQSGDVTFVNLSSLNPEQTFVRLTMSVNGLASVGKYLLAQDDANAWETHYILDKDGVVTDFEDWNYYSPVYAWNESNSRVYFFRDSSPGDLMFETISQTGGTILSDGETPYHGDYRFSGTIQVSPNGAFVFVGSGEVFDANTMLHLASISQAEDAIWNSQGHLISLIYTSGNAFIGNSYIERRNQDLELVERTIIEGRPRLIFGSEQTFSVISEQRSTFRVVPYTPNNDSDNDGVSNEDDDFPFDIAASLDSDKDGYPDQWNVGYSAEDSTTGLIALDSFPLDPTCWLDSHSNGKGACDYRATMPDFLPATTADDSEGIIYLFNAEQGLVYRWSNHLKEYISPIRLGKRTTMNSALPLTMVHSSYQQRLYFTYDNGGVTYVDLSAEAPLEQDFYHGGTTTVTLFTVKDLIFVRYLYASGEINVIKRSGEVLSQIDISAYSNFVWSDARNKLIGTQSSYWIYEYDLNLVTGTVSGERSLNIPGSGGFTFPLYISSDGKHLLSSTGSLYDFSENKLIGSIAPVRHAAWRSNNELLSIESADQQFTLTRRSSDFRITEQKTYSGTFLNLTDLGDEILVTFKRGHEFVFESYIPNDDIDGDGVANLLDAFPTDVAASVDSDGDGAPDAWNNGYDEEDSSNNLELDEYPNDFSCWLVSHDNGNGGCDYSITMPRFIPAKILYDSAGTIYLYNNELAAVYRWSMVSQEYLKPIYLKGGNQINFSAPGVLAISESHNRLYLGYSSGEISYVDLQGDLSEQPFVTLTQAAEGIASVGNYILAQDASGSWNTHYVLDRDGVVVDSKDWNYYSRDYAWNPVNNRVYFFRDGTSPNDLHFEEIDPSNGLITEEGDSPYHSGTHIRVPIRVVADGQYVLLGSGKLYDAETLVRTHELPVTLVDAIDFSDFVAIARTDTLSWYVELYNYESFELDVRFRLDGQILGIARYGYQIAAVEADGEGYKITLIELGDTDNDSLPAWWEIKYDLSDSDAGDAGLDNDQDGLTNLQEFEHGTSPNHSDTDGDTLTDLEEVSTYFTHPARADSDEDGLFDHDEILIHGTDPLLADSDNDLYSDAEEIYLYKTTPTDSTSVPQQLTSFSESFETGNIIASIWKRSPLNSADWEPVDDAASDGQKSLKAGDAGSHEDVIISITARFAEGTLSFDTKVDTGCCSRVSMSIDNQRQIYTTATNWTTHTVEISEGEHTIQWQFHRYNINDNGWIDNIEFEAN